MRARVSNVTLVTPNSVWKELWLMWVCGSHHSGRVEWCGSRQSKYHFSSSQYKSWKSQVALLINCSCIYLRWSLCWRRMAAGSAGEIVKGFWNIEISKCLKFNTELVAHKRRHVIRCCGFSRCLPGVIRRKTHSVVSPRTKVLLQIQRIFCYMCGLKNWIFRTF
jgi:hypothetical protein